MANKTGFQVNTITIYDVNSNTPLLTGTDGTLVANPINLTTDVSGALPPTQGGTGHQGTYAPSGILCTDADGNFSAVALNAGELLIGTGTDASMPSAAQLVMANTASQLTMFTGSGFITLGTAQPIGVGDGPTFANLTLAELIGATGSIVNPGATLSVGPVQLTEQVAGALPISHGGTGVDDQLLLAATSSLLYVSTANDALAAVGAMTTDYALVVGAGTSVAPEVRVLQVNDANLVLGTSDSPTPTLTLDTSQDIGTNAALFTVAGAHVTSMTTAGAIVATASGALTAEASLPVAFGGLGSSNSSQQQPLLFASGEPLVSNDDGTGVTTVALSTDGEILYQVPSNGPVVGMGILTAPSATEGVLVSAVTNTNTITVGFQSLVAFTDVSVDELTCGILTTTTTGSASAQVTIGDSATVSTSLVLANEASATAQTPVRSNTSSALVTGAVNLASGSSDITGVLGVSNGGTGLTTLGGDNTNVLLVGGPGDAGGTTSSVLTTLALPIDTFPFFDGTSSSLIPVQFSTLGNSDGVTVVRTGTTMLFGLATALTLTNAVFSSSATIGSLGVDGSLVVGTSGSVTLNGLVASTPVHTNSSDALVTGPIDLSSTSSDITGSLPVTRGGTGLTSVGAGALIRANTTAAMSALAMTAAGQIVYATSATTISTPVLSGATGQVSITANASAATLTVSLPSTVSMTTANVATSLAATTASITNATVSSLLSISSALTVASTASMTLNSLAASTPVHTDSGNTLVTGPIDLTYGSHDITGTLPVTSGGTGLVTAAATSLLRANTTAAMTALPISAVGQIAYALSANTISTPVLRGTANQIAIVADTDAATLTVSLPSPVTMTNANVTASLTATTASITSFTAAFLSISNSLVISSTTAAMTINGLPASMPVLTNSSAVLVTGPIDLSPTSNDYTGTLPVNRGGTGLTTITAGALLRGNGTTAATAVVMSAAGSFPYAVTTSAISAPTLAGTTNQIAIVADTSAATLTLSLPATVAMTNANVSTSLVATTASITNATVSSLLSISSSLVVSSTTAAMTLNGLAASTPVHTDASETLITGPIDVTSSDVTGTLPVSHGGTGVTTLASGTLLRGSGTTALTTVALNSGVGQIAYALSTSAISTPALLGTTNQVVIAADTAAATLTWSLPSTVAMTNASVSTSLTATNGSFTNVTASSLSLSGALSLSSTTASLTVGGLAASTPVQTNGTETLVAAPINLSSGSTQRTGTLPMARGGTGLTTVAANALVRGNGTAALTTVALTAAGQIPFAVTTSAISTPTLSGNQVTITASTSAATLSLALPATVTMTSASVSTSLAATNASFTNATASTLTVSGTPLSLAATATLTLSGLTASTPVSLNASKAIAAADIDLSAAAGDVGGTLPVANGGLGTSTLGSNGILYTGTASAVGTLVLGANTFPFATAANVVPRATSFAAAANSLTITPTDTTVQFGMASMVALTSASVSGSLTLSALTVSSPVLTTTSSALTAGPIPLSSTTAVTGPLPVSSGGTGQTSIAAGQLVLGAGTSGVSTLSLGANQIPYAATANLIMGCTLAGGPNQIAITADTSAATLAIGFVDTPTIINMSVSQNATAASISSPAINGTNMQCSTLNVNSLNATSGAATNATVTSTMTATLGNCTSASIGSATVTSSLVVGGSAAADAWLSTVNGNIQYYDTGLISQSGNTITGSGGAAFTTALVGGTVFSRYGAAQITAVPSITTLTVDTSQSQSTAVTYCICYGTDPNSTSDSGVIATPMGTLYLRPQVNAGMDSTSLTVQMPTVGAGGATCWDINTQNTTAPVPYSCNGRWLFRDQTYGVTAEWWTRATGSATTALQTRFMVSAYGGVGNTLGPLLTWCASPVTYNSSATIAAADLVNGALQATSATSLTLQMPTAAAIDAVIVGYGLAPWVSMSFETFFWNYSNAAILFTTNTGITLSIFSANSVIPNSFACQLRVIRTADTPAYTIISETT